MGKVPSSSVLVVMYVISEGKGAFPLCNTYIKWKQSLFLEYTLKALKDLKDQRIRLIFSLIFSSYYTATILRNPV
jgi:hypothetical protein